MTVPHEGVFIACFVGFIALFLGSTVLFGFNAKNFHRSGNSLVTEDQKKGSRNAILGLLFLVISLIGFLLTLIAFYHIKPRTLPAKV